MQNVSYSAAYKTGTNFSKHCFVPVEWSQLYPRPWRGRRGGDGQIVQHKVQQFTGPVHLSVGHAIRESLNEKKAR